MVFVIAISLPGGWSFYTFVLGVADTNVQDHTPGRDITII